MGLSLDFVATNRSADGSAISEAATYQPQAHWSIVRRTFDPWSNDVTSGQTRLTGGAWPAWVIELTAPGDSRKGYSAVVVVNAFTGAASGVSVSATDSPGLFGRSDAVAAEGVSGSSFCLEMFS